MRGGIRLHTQTDGGHLQAVVELERLGSHFERYIRETTSRANSSDGRVRKGGS